MNIRSRLSKRELRIAIVTVVLAAVFGGYVFFLEPLALAWLDLREQVVKADQELIQLKTLVQNKDTIANEYKHLQGAVSVGKTEQELKVSLLTEVDGLVRGCGLEVSSVKPTTVKKEGLFHRYGLELQVHCAGHQFAKLLQVLQEPEHLLRTDQMVIAVSPGEPPMTVTLKVSKLAKLKEAS